MTVSSKALFRATVRKPVRVGSALFDDLPEHRAPDGVRRADDFYPTVSPDPVRALLVADWAAIAACGSVWEPACGAGDMVRPIRAAGLPCVATDLRDRGCPDSSVADYFAVSEALAPAIITNPPYDLINARDGRGRWLRHTLDMPGWDYLALLLSWDWPAAKANGLGGMLDAQPFTRAYLMRWKIDFTGEGSPPQRNAWFVWDRRDVRTTRGAGMRPEFCWLDRLDDRQGGMF